MLFKLFRQESQTCPAVKKAGDFINTKSHNQKKYISLMLVPSYTGGKTRSLHIPRTVFQGLVLCVFIISALIFGFYLRGVHFERISQNLGYTLGETIEAFDEFQQIAELTHNDLTIATFGMYEQLTTGQAQAQLELERQTRRHESDLYDVQAHVDEMERQIRLIADARVEVLSTLETRAAKIPPIAAVISQLEASQEYLAEYLSLQIPEAVITPQIGLMGVGTYVPLSEAELSARLEVLIVELDIQRQLFENIDSYRRQIDNYLRNFPTLMPVDNGRITSWFGNRSDPINGSRAFHFGVDIPAPMGTPIRAAGGGTVIFEGWRSGFGNVVFIDHGGGLVTRYAHNTRNAVVEGQRVERGDIIAYVGSTGRSISPHLHYEVLQNGRQVNPVPFITENY
ncbi:MAG: M23 family metallopeptidase [Defluviitaleaceae bacterium]|nr:M23 family metallopeptidase [Defluviitaleaceae bacterium]